MFFALCEKENLIGEVLEGWNTVLVVKENTSIWHSLHQVMWTWVASIFHVLLSNSIKLPNYYPPYSQSNKTTNNGTQRHQIIILIILSSLKHIQFPILARTSDLVSGGWAGFRSGLTLVGTETAVINSYLKCELEGKVGSDCLHNTSGHLDRLIWYICSRFDSSDIAEPGPMSPFNQILNQFASKGSALSVLSLLYLIHISLKFSYQRLLQFL